MSDPGKYRFLPWLRRGIAAHIADVDDGRVLPARAHVDVTLNLDSTHEGVVTSTPVSKSINIYGPGDISGLTVSHVIRTEPRANTHNFEPNYLAGIEFDTPDFPWLFTPAAANGDRLHPWLALIALKKDEFKEQETTKTSTDGLPSIGVTKVSALQNLDENWCFAHVQASSEEDITQLLKKDPGHVISRLLCPRRLDPETDYYVFLVPAFDIGRKAGLGVKDLTEANATPAWTSATPMSNEAPYPMPFYYRFSFHTSDEGDFESLVRRLVPRVLPPSVGQRSVAVAFPGAGYPNAGPPLKFQGALIRPGTELDNWTEPGHTDFQAELKKYLNMTTPTIDDPASPNKDDPVVVPPMYGRWHAGVQSTSQVNWLDDLNLDPRWRTPAGFGTEVVQTKRTPLLASAWQQVDGIIAANRLLKQAQVARAAMTQLYKQHLKTAPATTLLAWTAPAHSRILASPNTVHSYIRNSPIPQRVLSGAFRKIVRPLGPLRRRQGIQRIRSINLIIGINNGTLEITPPAKLPDGTISIDKVSDELLPAYLRGINMPIRLFFELVVLVIILLVLMLMRTGNSGLALMVSLVLGLAITNITDIIKKDSKRIEAAEAIRISSLTTETIARIAPNPNFVLTMPGEQPEPSSTLNGGGGERGDSPEAAAFRRALIDYAGVLQVKQPRDIPHKPIDLENLQTVLLSKLNPSVTIPLRTRSIISLSNLAWNPADPITPIMAAPEFPQPMYAPLRDLSQEYILPGVGSIPPNSLGLLQTNNAFIEAYMVGLNHEMARQLLVNHYPTDQRGSYFQQFWDVSAYVPQPDDPTSKSELNEMLKDIPPVHTWSKDTRLGDNKNPKKRNNMKSTLVLVVRGELLKRYPNTIIFAGPATLEEGKIVLDKSERAKPLYKHPILTARFSPDITCIGFNLTASEALGNDHRVPHGYFFGFQQVPTESRFGLQPDKPPSPVKYWSDLSWVNFADTGSDTTNSPQPNFVGGFSSTRLSSTILRHTLSSVKLPDFVPAMRQPRNVQIGPGGDNASMLDKNVAWGTDSSQAAYILLRRPFRIMVHAKRMLSGIHG